MKRGIWYFKLYDTFVNGPFTSLEMKERLQAGVIGADTPVRLGEDGVGWKTAENFGSVLATERTIEQILIDALDSETVGAAPMLRDGTSVNAGSVMPSTALRQKAGLRGLPYAPCATNADCLQYRTRFGICHEGAGQSWRPWQNCNPAGGP